MEKLKKIYENSVMVFITDSNKEDSIVVNEYNKRAIVSKKNAKITKKIIIHACVDYVIIISYAGIV